MLICGVILLVGVAGFLLGRLSIAERSSMLPSESQAGVSLVEGSEVQKNEGLPAVVGATDGSVVASKSGSKYHFPWCAGAQSIKESNKVWFASIAEARAAGYEPASNCKGLE